MKTILPLLAALTGGLILTGCQAPSRSGAMGAGMGFEPGEGHGEQLADRCESVCAKALKSDALEFGDTRHPNRATRETRWVPN